MKKIISVATLFLFSLLILSCGADQTDETPQDEYHQENEDTETVKDTVSESTTSSVIPSVLPEIGMTIEELRAIYSNADFTPMKGHKYGFDGGFPGYDVTQNDEYLFHVTKDGVSDTIVHTILLSPRYKYRGTYVGMTATDLLKKYPDTESYINLYNGLETIAPDSSSFIATFNTTDKARMANYVVSEETGEPEFIAYKNTNFPILTIAIRE